MPKTLPPGLIEVPGTATFTANVVPDVFDERDLDYRPRLQPLPATVDKRADRYVMTQEGNSCTGHAVAAMVNAVLAQGDDATHVSPYMLYRLARRYDEFEGDEDAGSSLRGVLKGWFYHGVLPDDAWPKLDPDVEPDIDEEAELAALAARRPLGAFYRVNAFRLDDMQSAVNELSAIVASAAVHEGWVTPTLMQRDSEQICVIERPVSARPLGGHAFTIVGYNDVGFLVQNSWGEEWGKGGFATLPYDDWLASAYDAWVARPGVHSIVSLRSNRAILEVTGGGLASGPAQDLVRLARHVVNLGNDGRLSATGRFVSTPTQVHRMVERMGEYHELWRTRAQQSGSGAGSPPPRRVVLYAHGGLNDESTGLSIAQQQLNWWLNNSVYPITFAWQSGPIETMMNQLADTAKRVMPFGGIGFDFVEQFDRAVEKLAKTSFRWMWGEMKQNARAASQPLGRAVTWPTAAGETVSRSLADLPGASLFVSRLAQYASTIPSGERLEVHLAGHSAGSVFLAALLGRLVEAGLPVTSMTFLAPAIRVDDFAGTVLPHLRSGKVAGFASFGLSDKRELDDVCGAGKVTVYQKSLLYLVSRALESPVPKGGEVPLLGMQKFQNADVGGATLSNAIRDKGGALVWAHSDSPAQSRTDAKTHGGFDDDGPTMTSVMLRVLGLTAPTSTADYEPHSALVGLQPAPEPAALRLRPRQRQRPDQAPTVAEAADAGASPVTVMAEPQLVEQTAPPVAGGPFPEARSAPAEESPIRQALAQSGWGPAGGSW